MDSSKKRVVSRAVRACRIRKKIFGTSERPRLCVRRSLNHIYAQLVDDENGITIAEAGSTAKECVARGAGKKKMEISKLVGEMLAEKAKEKGVQRVVFDRKGYLYHGRVKALADAARSKGLVF
ncbi:MAG: 50S ribosomal protein L18 [Chitinispirillaceae bacterium]|nr:50S ribosomal protein L18 [Chitinispirillaceae bacterium]